MGLKLTALPLVGMRGPPPRKLIILPHHVINEFKRCQGTALTWVYESWSSPLPFIKGSIPVLLTMATEHLFKLTIVEGLNSS